MLRLVVGLGVNRSEWLAVVEWTHLFVHVIFGEVVYLTSGIAFVGVP